MSATAISLLCALTVQGPGSGSPAPVTPDAGSDLPFPEFARPKDGTISDGVAVNLADLEPQVQSMITRLAPALAGPEPRPQPDATHAIWRLPRSGRVLLIAGDDASPDRSMIHILTRTGAGDVVATGMQFDMQGSAHWMSVQEADVDGDGHVDVLLHSSAMGCGLAAGAGWDWIIRMYPGGPGRAPRASLLELPTSYGVYPLDVDGNGRLEFLLRMYGGCERCIDGKPHNFWVWELVGIQDGRLVDLNGTVTDFPRFEWLSFDPKDRWRPLLTAAMKKQLRGEGTGLPPYQRRRK